MELQLGVLMITLMDSLRLLIIWTGLGKSLDLSLIKITTYLPSIRDRVHRNENFVEIIPV